VGLRHLGGANKEGAEQRAAGAADVGEQRHSGVLKNKTDVFIGNGRQFFHHLAEAAIHIQTVVGIANLFIQAGQKIFLFGKNVAAAIEPVNDLRSVQ
jgi:hypothetical protein